jgi:16S rRNA (uracil1498-N3)-methyltransferase
MAHVPHLHLPGSWDGGAIDLVDEQRHHLTRVLRRPAGTPVTYTDGAGTVGEGSFDGAVVIRGPERAVAAPLALTMAVAVPHAADRARMIVEKLQELGVARLIWLRTRYGQGRPPRGEKARRWAVAALEQSRGAHLMIVEGSCGFDGLSRPLVVADSGGGDPALRPPLTVAIGPEGGWAAGEIPDDAALLGLGDTVLRTETAAIAAAVLVEKESGSERR